MYYKFVAQIRDNYSHIYMYSISDKIAGLISFIQRRGGASISWDNTYIGTTTNGGREVYKPTRAGPSNGAAFFAGGEKISAALSAEATYARVYSAVQRWYRLKESRARHRQYDRLAKQWYVRNSRERESIYSQFNHSCFPQWISDSVRQWRNVSSVILIIVPAHARAGFWSPPNMWAYYIINFSYNTSKYLSIHSFHSTNAFSCPRVKDNNKISRSMMRHNVQRGLCENLSIVGTR